MSVSTSGTDRFVTGLAIAALIGPAWGLWLSYAMQSFKYMVELSLPAVIAAVASLVLAWLGKRGKLLPIAALALAVLAAVIGARQQAAAESSTDGVTTREHA